MCYVCQVNEQRNGMDAKQLIRIAETKGIAIARYKAGIYQYWTNGQAPINFTGTWAQFAKFIAAK